MATLESIQRYITAGRWQRSQFFAPFYTPSDVTSPYTQSGTYNWLEKREGEPVEGWELRIRTLQAASSNYSRQGVATYQLGKIHYSGGLVKGNEPQRRRKYTESYWGSYLVTPSIPAESASAYEIALGNFLKNAGSKQTPLKGMILLGELGKTLQMLMNPASALRDGLLSYLKRAHRIIKDAKRKHRKKRKRWSGRDNARLGKVLAKTWLEYSFGWMNLVRDIKDATAAYSAFEARAATARAYGKCEIEIDKISTKTSSTFMSYGYHHLTTTKTRKDKVVLKGVLKMSTDVMVSDAERVQQLCGFNLAEFVPTVWELVPASWVVDMFTNVGDILNSIHGITSNWVWYTASRRTSSLTESKYSDDSVKRAGLSQTAENTIVLDYFTSIPFVFEHMVYTRWIPIIRLPVPVIKPLPSRAWSWANLLSWLRVRQKA